MPFKISASMSVNDRSVLAVLEQIAQQKHQELLVNLPVKEYSELVYPNFLSFTNAVKIATEPIQVTDEELVQCVKNRLAGVDYQLAEIYLEQERRKGRTPSSTEFISTMNHLVTGQGNYTRWINLRLQQSDVELSEFKTYATRKFLAINKTQPERELKSILQEVALYALPSISDTLLQQIDDGRIREFLELLNSRYGPNPVNGNRHGGHSVENNTSQPQDPAISYHERPAIADRPFQRSNVPATSNPEGVYKHPFLINRTAREKEASPMEVDSFIANEVQQREQADATGKFQPPTEFVSPLNPPIAVQYRAAGTVQSANQTYMVQEFSADSNLSGEEEKDISDSEEETDLFTEADESSDPSERLSDETESE